MTLVWVDLAAVLAAHDWLLADYGGREGVRDPGALERARSRPPDLVGYRSEPPDLADLAATYAAGIARPRHFADGNKRTAWATPRDFLRLNGYPLGFDKAEAVAIVEAVAKGTGSAADLAAWFRSRLIPSKG